eukprot:366067-Chlamydomonas_euryale.AAC.9
MPAVDHTKNELSACPLFMPSLHALSQADLIRGGQLGLHFPSLHGPPLLSMQTDAISSSMSGTELYFLPPPCTHTCSHTRPTCQSPPGLVPHASSCQLRTHSPASPA